jgi:hypothetical protein
MCIFLIGRLRWYVVVVFERVYEDQLLLDRYCAATVRRGAAPPSLSPLSIKSFFLSLKKSLFFL